MESDYEQRVLRELEASLSPDGAGAPGRGRLWPQALRSGRVTWSVIAVLALSVVTLGVALPAPIDVCVGVLGYVTAVGFLARVVVSVRRRRRGPQP